MLNNAGGSGNRRLVTVDTDTGVGTTVGTAFGNDFRPTGIAFLNDVLYMTTNHNRNLYSVNTATAAHNSSRKL